jgi:POT family proton-dependent oligopeptide transporter
MKTLQSNVKQSLSSNAILYSLARLFERAGYYGFRSILILYLISASIGMTEIEAMALYGKFTGLFYASKLFGGFIGDLLFGNRLAVLIGVTLQFIGVLAMCLPNTFGLYTGLTFLIIGTGLYDSNLIALVAKEFLKQPKQIDSGFGLFYIGVNLGAFLGVLLVTVLSTIELYYGFLIAAVFFSISAGIVWAVKENELTVSEVEPIDKPQFQVKPKHVVVTLLAFIISSLFWMFYEFTSPVLMFANSDLNEVALEVTGFKTYEIITNINSIVIVAIGGLLSLFWFYYYSNSLLKVAIGFLMAALSLFILSLVPELVGTNALYVFITAAVLIGIGEFFVVPPILSLITLHANPDYLASVMGGFGYVSSLFFGLSYGLSNVIEFYFELDNNAILLVGIIGLSTVALGVLILYFSLNQSKTSIHKVDTQL